MPLEPLPKFSWGGERQGALQDIKSTSKQVTTGAHEAHGAESSHELTSSGRGKAPQGLSRKAFIDLLLVGALLPVAACSESASDEGSNGDGDSGSGGSGQGGSQSSDTGSGGSAGGGMNGEGTGGDSSTGAGTGGDSSEPAVCSQEIRVESSGNGHTHFLTLSAAFLAAGEAGVIDTDPGTHTHCVYLSAEEIMSIKAGMVVTKFTCSGGDHQFVIGCGQSLPAAVLPPECGGNEDTRGQQGTCGP